MCRRLIRLLLGGFLLLLPARSPAAEPPRLDLQGDPLPAGAIARRGTERLRHVIRDYSGAACLAFTPDGKTLISGADVGLRAWDVATGKDLGWFQAPAPATAAQFSPDGKTLVTANNGGTIRWLEAGTGKLLREVRQLPEGSIPGMETFFSANGKVWGVFDGSGKIRLWEAGSGHLLLTCQGDDRGLMSSAALSPDGKVLAVSGKRNRAHLIDVLTGKAVRQIKGPNWAPELREGFPRIRVEAVHGFTFSPDGRLLAATGIDFVAVWDAATGERRYLIRDDHGRLAFSPDGKYLACGGEELCLYGAATGKKVRRFEGHTGNIAGLAFSPDGTTLATAQEYAICLWDVKTGKRRLPFPGHETPVGCLAFAPDGTALASGADDLIVWDLKTRRPRYACTGHYTGVLSVAYAPDGKMLATGDGYGGGGTGGRDARIRLWNSADGRLLRDFHGHINSVEGLAFAPDGRSLASVGHDARARLWDVATGKCLFQIRGLDSPFRSVAFAPDGKAVAVAGNRGELALWRSDTGELLRELGRSQNLHPQTLRVAFLGDSRTVLSCEAGGPLGPNMVRIWDADSGRWLRSFKTDVSVERSSFALAPDGKTLALAGTFTPDTSIQLWDTVVSDLVLRLPGHGGASVTALAFSPDGKVLASGSRDTTILLWDVARARLERLWSALTAGPGDAARALKRAAATPEKAVAFLTERLARVQDCEGRAAVLLADLDDDRYAVREKATRDLGRLGPEAAFPLRLALEGSPSVEARRRIEEVLEDKKRTGEDLSAYDARGVTLAVAFLEEISGPDAQQALAELARGPARSVVAREARAARERLTRRRNSP
jgi:WD40 repeat protein